jgi:hypothetical protein
MPAISGHRHCIAAETVVVVSRSTYTTDHDDSPQNPPFPGPPQPPPVIPGPYGFGPVLAWTQTHYTVTIRTPDGRRHTYDVTKEFYDAARTGTTARAEVWRGHLTRLTIGSADVQLDAAPGFFTAWLLAWAGVMMIVATIAYPLGTFPVFNVFFLWTMGTIIFGWFGGWRPAAYLVPLIFVTAIFVWRFRDIAERWCRRRKRPAGRW